MELRAATVAERLGLGSDYTAWLASLEELGPPAHEVRLPAGTEAVGLLDELGVAEIDRDAILATLPAAAESPEVWWLLERTYHSVQRDVGDTAVAAMRPMPSLPA